MTYDSHTKENNMTNANPTTVRGHRPPCVDGRVCGEAAHCPPRDRHDQVTVHACDDYPAMDGEHCYAAEPRAVCGTRRDEHADTDVESNAPELDITDHTYAPSRRHPVAHPAAPEKVRDSLIHALNRAEGANSGVEDVAAAIIAQLKVDGIIVTAQLETFDDQTLAKVYDALLVDLDREQARDMVTRMMNAGILFRERAKPQEVAIATSDPCEYPCACGADEDEHCRCSHAGASR